MSGPAGPTEVYADDSHRYRLVSRIASGGMGEVWRATDSMLQREVAVKLLRPEYADDSLFRSRFAAEARHSASLQHPGIAGVFDAGEARPVDGSSTPRPYLVMELVEGQPLSALLRGGRPMAPDAVADLMAQAADAVGVAHAAGIVHRDIKPANLLVTRDRQIKITDFGIARATEGLALTQSGQVMGTPQYLSPEQASGSRATPASDVYSLGVVAYECLAGQRPFLRETAVATALAHVRDTPPALPGDVPADLAAVVMRALQKKPADRFPDGAAFAAALRDPAGVAASGGDGADAGGPAAVVAPPAATETAVLTSVTGLHPPPGERLPVPPPPADPLPDEPASGRGKVPGWLVAVAAVAAVAVLSLLGWLLFSGDGEADEPTDDPSSSATSASPSETPETVQVDEDDYVGRSVDAVAAELVARGLRVDTVAARNDGSQDAGIVTGLSPSGTLEPGELVTVTYWGDPPEPTESPSESPEESPSPSEPTESPSDSPGEGTGDDGNDGEESAGGQVEGVADDGQR